MRILVALVCILIAGSAHAGIFGAFGRPDVDPEIKGPADYASIRYGVTPGIAFADFLAASPEDEFLLSGSVAYVTPDGFWFEFGPLAIGDEAPSVGTMFTIGHRVTSAGPMEAYLGGDVATLEDVTTFAGRGWLQFAAFPWHDIRIGTAVDQDGKPSTFVGFMLVETID